MNPDIKARWVQALRSGQYNQGHGLLKRRESNHYCCLGVLCDIAVQEGVAAIVENETSYQDGVLYADLQGNVSKEALPLGVAVWAGCSHDPEVTVIREKRDGRCYEEAENLTLLNDEGSTFAEIADWIEEQL